MGNDIEASRNHAFKLHKDGNYQEALEAYQQILTSYPDDHEVHFQLAILYQQTRRPDNALESYRNCVNVKPDHTQAVLALSQLLYNGREFAESEQYLTTELNRLKNLGLNSAELDKYFPLFLALIAECLLAQGRIHRGLELLHERCQMVEQPLVNPKTWARKARAHFLLHQYEEAFDAIENGMRCATVRKTVPLLEIKAELLARVGRYREAEQCFIEVSYLRSNARFLLQHAQCATSLRKYDVVLSNANKYITLRPKFSHGHYLKGSVSELTRNYKDAAKSYAHVINRVPRYSGFRNSKLESREIENVFSNDCVH